MIAKILNEKEIARLLRKICATFIYANTNRKTFQKAFRNPLNFLENFF